MKKNINVVRSWVGFARTKWIKVALGRAGL